MNFMLAMYRVAPEATRAIACWNFAAPSALQGLHVVSGAAAPGLIQDFHYGAAAMKLLEDRGTPLDRQRFTWRELSPKPISKLDDDAFTRVRIILMNGIEHEALRFQHSVARFNTELRLPLAKIRQVEHHQATLVNWLIGADHSPLETTIGYEQTAIEVTAAMALREPDPYVAQTLRFGLLEDFDHLYRYSALLDRLEGKDANNITQSYTDIVPGRPTRVHHRIAEDNLRRPVVTRASHPLTKLHALTITAGEQQTHNYYMNIGPLFADPLARQLYAEIASIEEQHVTQYESLLDPEQSFLEQWLMHEAMEVYNYFSCAKQESNSRIKGIWERMLDYEQGHLHAVAELFKQAGRDPLEVLPQTLPEPLPYESQREFVRSVLMKEVDMRSRLTEYVDSKDESLATRSYRDAVNAAGSPSEAVAAGYHYQPGTELSREVPPVAA
jgi:rubrerythrin